MQPFDLIDELRDMDRHTRADVERLREMSQRHPDCPELWDVLGDIQQICVDHQYATEESLACYRRAIQLDPQYAPGHVSLGYAYDAHYDEFSKAAKHFRLAIACGAGDTARVGLARVQAQLGDAEGANAELDSCEDQNDHEVVELRRQIAEGLWFDEQQAEQRDEM